MNWPWVRRSRLEEAERFWIGMVDRWKRLANEAHIQAESYVDRICELTREREQQTVGVGLVPNRSDYLLSLHVGTSWVLLNVDEAKRLADQLKSFERRTWDDPLPPRRRFNEKY